MLQSFFDPGHGFLSSVDEWLVAVIAFVLLTLVGAVAEYLGDAKGITVLAAMGGYIIALFIWAPPFIATEWHYAVMIAIPLVVISYLYRRHGE